MKKSRTLDLELELCKTVSQNPRSSREQRAGAADSDNLQFVDWFPCLSVDKAAHRLAPAGPSAAKCSQLQPSAFHQFEI